MVDPSNGIQFAVYANDISVSRKQHIITSLPIKTSQFFCIYLLDAELMFTVVCCSTGHPKFIILYEKKTKPDYYEDHPTVIFIFHVIVV